MQVYLLDSSNAFQNPRTFNSLVVSGVNDPTNRYFVVLDGFLFFDHAMGLWVGGFCERHGVALGFVFNQCGH